MDKLTRQILAAVDPDIDWGTQTETYKKVKALLKKAYDQGYKDGIDDAARVS